MKQEDKELLLKDLCARLPYGVMIESLDNIPEKLNFKSLAIITTMPKHEYLAYLRPMSSMTEEEQNEFDDFCVIDEEAWKGNGIVGYINQAKIITEAMDFLNQHHFDYRGLIEKGLALEAPEGMYQ